MQFRILCLNYNYAEHVAPVSDLRVTNRCSCFWFNCIQTNQFLSQATPFASDLLQCLIFQSLTPTALSIGSPCEFLLLPLACPFKQYQYHPAHLVKQIKIDSPYSTISRRISPFYCSYPFYVGTSRLIASSGFALWAKFKPCRGNYRS